MESFLGGKVVLHCGDSLEILKDLPDNSVDSCVCDPPYHLTSIVKRFGNETMSTSQRRFAKTGAADRLPGTDQYGRLSTGFMGKKWDGGDIAFRTEVWEQVLRVLKPGGHLAAFSGTRTYHRMACAIEDAGFEIRDQIGWAYGSGFPKSHDVSKGIDRTLGAERDKVPPRSVIGHQRNNGNVRPYMDDPDHMTVSDTPATAEAERWSGWGTALKPAWEPIVLARKPLSESTVATNVLRWGTGAINVDGCRVQTKDIQVGRDGEPTAKQVYCGNGATNFSAKPGLRRVGAVGWGGPLKRLSAVPGQEGKLVARTEPSNLGRWPANLVHDGSEEVITAFPDSDGQQGDLNATNRDRPTKTCFGDMAPPLPHLARNDSGSAARFFYTAKADSDDRIGSKHPTVKPVDLMQWLVRLVTPPQGMVLDLFAGTGTTGEAAWREGMSATLIEREEEYQADIRRRMALATAGPDERARESIKAKTKDKPVDAGPLFGGT